MTRQGALWREQLERTKIPAKGLIRASAVRTMCGNISRTTERRWIEENILPAPIKIRGQKYYYVSEIELLMDRLAEAADGD
jgi:predicted DNA-binding transcriptional regulator AlpA